MFKLTRESDIGNILAIYSVIWWISEDNDYGLWSNVERTQQNLSTAAGVCLPTSSAAWPRRCHRRLPQEIQAVQSQNSLHLGKQMYRHICVATSSILAPSLGFLGSKKSSWGCNRLLHLSWDADPFSLSEGMLWLCWTVLSKNKTCTKQLGSTMQYLNFTSFHIISPWYFTILVDPGSTVMVLFRSISTFFYRRCWAPPLPKGPIPRRSLPKHGPWQMIPPYLSTAWET